MDKFILQIKRWGAYIFSLLFLSLCYSVLCAQDVNYNTREFNAYKCEIGSSFGLAIGNAYNFGYGISLHPSYYVNDYLNIGFRGEISLIVVEDDGHSLSSLTTFQLTARYYFTKSWMRPYYSTGAGLYVFGLDEDKEYRFGIAPKIGFDIGPVNVYISYHYILGPEQGEERRNHLDMGAGFFIGGRKK